MIALGGREVCSISRRRKMTKTARLILALSLALVLSLAVIGCDRGLPQDEIDRIIDNVTSAQSDTMKMDMDMDVTMTVKGGASPGQMTMTGTGSGVMDMVNHKMQMAMDMSMDIPEMGVQAFATESYLVGEWMYTSFEIPELGEQWLKTALTPDVWEQQNQLAQQIEFLKTAVKVKSLPDEAVDGTNCYVFEVEPSLEALGDLLSQQSSVIGMDFSQLDLADLFKEMRIKEWIAQDSYQVLKSEVYIQMQIKPADVGASEADFDTMVMDMNIAVRLYDYNQPVSIELPAEALDAQEISS
jgi:hypothetical protein